MSTSIVVACIEATLVPCGDLACSEGLVCTPGGCATEQDAEACVGIEDGSQCVTDEIADGTCIGGACRAVVCGNGTLDHNEICDDGNLIPGDGCSLDCMSNEECGNGVVDPVVGEQCDDGGIRGLSGDGCSSTCKIEVDTWRDVTPTKPAPRAGGAIAHDRSGRLVLFGGTTEAIDRFTWQWDGLTWIKRDPPTRPASRSNPGFAYDAARGLTILFGGYAGSSTKYADTWAWDGVTWRQLAPATSPPARSNAQLAYDAERDRIVMHGGLDANGASLADTWLWDGTTWTQVFPATSPGPRVGFLLAFHPVWRKVVLFGGSLAGATQTWSWDGTNWTNETTIGAPSFAGIMMTANDTGLLLIAGGETWQLDATWAKVAIPSQSFGAGSVLGFLAASGGVILESTAGTTFRLTSGWVNTPPVQNPISMPTVVTYDARRGRVVAIAAGGGAFAGTWEWDGLAWVRQTSTRPGCESVIYDSTRGRTVCIPFMTASVAEWDGSSWTDPVPGSAGPNISYPGFVFDTQLGAAVVIGGIVGSMQHSAAMWKWNGTSWAQLATTATPMIIPNLASDPLRGRVYSFGGRIGSGSGSDYDGMHEFDGTTWTTLAPSPRPPARNNAAFVYAPTRQRSVLFGGGTNGITVSGLTDTWQWDGATWSQRDPIISPPAGRYAGTTDPLGGVLLVGSDATWRLESAAPSTPSESCKTVEDRDGDGLSGCEDPDCWARCSPLCPPGTTCPADNPRCGDGACGPVEDYLICPADCTP